MRKDWLNVLAFQNRNWCSPKSDRWFFFLTLTVWGPFHRKDLKWRKTWGTGLLSVKTEALFAELNKKVEAATSSYSATSDFYNIFILFLWLGIIRRSNESVYFMNFPLQIFFNDINHGYRAATLKKNYLWLLPFYMVMTTQCYYEKVCRTMRTAIVPYLLKISLY